MTPPRLLIVEDDASIRMLIGAISQRLGMVRTTATNGEEAISLLRGSENYCAIVLDLMMPHVDGYAVIEHLKRTFRLVPVVVVTAAIAGLQWDRLDPLIVKSVVTKPFDIDKLQAAIEAACEPIVDTYRPPTDFEAP